jgi:hypothetical protein
MSTLIEKDTTMTKPYSLISTLSFNLKAFDFLNLIFTQTSKERGKATGHQLLCLAKSMLNTHPLFLIFQYSMLNA